jgi:hypothetical protein
MIRKLALAAAIAAFAVPAFAGTEVTIKVAGLNAKATHEAIVQAAQEACRAAFTGESSLVQFYNRPDCISHAVATAEAKYTAQRGFASR